MINFFSVKDACITLLKRILATVQLNCKVLQELAADKQKCRNEVPLVGVNKKFNQFSLLPKFPIDSLDVLKTLKTKFDPEQADTESLTNTRVQFVSKAKLQINQFLIFDNIQSNLLKVKQRYDKLKIF